MTFAGIAAAAAAGAATFMAVSPTEQPVSGDNATLSESDLSESQPIAQNATAEAGNTVELAGASEDDARPDIDAGSERETGSAAINFSRGSIDDLRNEQLSDLVDKMDRVADISEATKVWVAQSDIASAPGDETLYHVKGPITCGTGGCELYVMGEIWRQPVDPAGGDCRYD